MGFISNGEKKFPSKLSHNLLENVENVYRKRHEPSSIAQEKVHAMEIAVKLLRYKPDSKASLQKKKTNRESD